MSARCGMIARQLLRFLASDSVPLFGVIQTPVSSSCSFTVQLAPSSMSRRMMILLIPRVPGFPPFPE